MWTLPTPTARLGIKGTFECRDKDGNVIKTIDVNGSIPLERLGLTVEQAQELIDQQQQQQKEASHGTDDYQRV